MEWVVNMAFLLVGYLMRLLAEKPHQCKCSMNKPKKAIHFPKLNLAEAYQNKKDKEEKERLDRETSIMLENIDNYDGTGANQKEVE